MIGYTTVGAANMEKAAEFYEGIFSEMGAKRGFDEDTFKAWGMGPGQPGFAIIRPFDGNAPSAGNGVMIALAAPSREAVDKYYAKAMEMGATDEGAPGIRGGENSTFYAGYFRDLDGNKLNFFHM